MILSRNLIDLWDPEWTFRNHRRITFIQCLTLPLIPIGFLFTIPFDIITLPYQLRFIYRDD